MRYTIAHANSSTDYRCNFPAVYRIIRKHLGDGRYPSQTVVIGDIFAHFYADPAHPDLAPDQGNVNRWISGKSRVSPSISYYYGDASHLEAMIADIESKILPKMFDPTALAGDLYWLLSADNGVPDLAEDLIKNYYPVYDLHSIAVFVALVLYLSLLYPLH